MEWWVYHQLPWASLDVAFVLFELQDRTLFNMFMGSSSLDDLEDEESGDESDDEGSDEDDAWEVFTRSTTQSQNLKDAALEEVFVRQLGDISGQGNI